MKPELLLAIVAILIAVFNRPLEILWDKIFGIKKDTVKSIFIYIGHFVKYAAPIFGLIVSYIENKMDKSLIYFVSFFCFVLFFNIFSELFFHLSKRIRLLEEDNKQLKKQMLEGKVYNVNATLNEKQKEAVEKFLKNNNINPSV